MSDITLLFISITQAAFFMLTTVAGKHSYPQFRSMQSAPWLFAMVLFWGLSWPAMKLALASVPPFWLATLRFGSGALCLFVFAAVRGSLRLPPKGDWPIVASIAGLQMMAFTALGLTAMQFTNAGRAAVLGYTTPLWAMLGAWLLLRQRPTLWQGLALIVGLSGVALICSPLEMDWTNPAIVKGNLFLLLAAICWSLVILHVRQHRFVAKPIDLAPWQMLGAAVPLGIAALIWEGSPGQITWTPSLIELLVYIGPIATSACFVISTEHGRRVSTFAMSNITMGVPIIGVLSSALLLHERMSLGLVVGLVLIVAATALAGIVSFFVAARQRSKA
jgi:drug/metabolite transporter (DMT)-like permease